MKKLTEFFNKVIIWYKDSKQEIKDILNILIYLFVLIACLVFGLLTAYYLIQSNNNLTNLKFNYYITNTIGSLINFIFCTIYLERKQKEKDGK